MKLAIGDDFFLLICPPSHYPIRCVYRLIYFTAVIIINIIIFDEFSLMIRKIENEIKNHDNMCVGQECALEHECL